MIPESIKINSHISVKRVIQDYQVVLRPVNENDIEQLRLWRNSSVVQTQMLDQREISVVQQAAWFKRIQYDAREQHWVIIFRDKPIGSINLKSIEDSAALASAKTVSAGLYIGDPKYQANILAFAPSLALYDFCFNVLSVSHFEAIVKATNEPALNYNKRLGYTVVGGDEQIKIRLDRAAYFENTQMLKDLLSRSARR